MAPESPPTHKTSCYLGRAVDEQRFPQMQVSGPTPAAGTAQDDTRVLSQEALAALVQRWVCEIAFWT